MAISVAERLSPVLATGDSMYGLGVGDEEMREYHTSVWEKHHRYVSTLTQFADHDHFCYYERLMKGYPGFSKYQGTRYFVDVKNLDVGTTELRDNGMPQSIRFSRLKKLKHLQILEITIPLSEAPLIIGKIRKLRSLKKVVINLCCTKRDYVNNIHRTVMYISFRHLLKLQNLEHLSITANSGRYNNVKITDLESLRKLKKLKELDVSAVSLNNFVRRFLCFPPPFPIGMKRITICYDMARVLLMAARIYNQETPERTQKFEDLFDVTSEEEWTAVIDSLEETSAGKKGYIFYQCLKVHLDLFINDLSYIVREAVCERVNVYLDSSILGTNKDFDPVSNFQHDIDLVMKNYHSFVSKWFHREIKSLYLEQQLEMVQAIEPKIHSTNVKRLKVYRSFVPANERTKKQSGNVIYSIDKGIYSL